MNERAKEILSDAAKYLGDAAHEWKDGLADHPIAHVYTAVAAIVLFSIVRAFF